ncbi:MAG: class I SAM-dependent methyltransferase [Phenylobacterium sp.]|uniref:class I SAM-dependent methyltransferase n=1 Tax=Phenylobacterium sp. TaxID=1871053 RepID=UPI002734F343|nr:class I SAM-dependent methyltransferase [Phenylobacterium sp.]MDP3749408.1 class I SAM-dependent methyltransferase [Phenylobacterium sp.]
MAEVRSYYSEKGLTATFYDLTTAMDPSLAGDIDIYRSLVPPEGSVLELGVGTGRVAFALAESGLTVTGIDLAPTMLVQARAKLAAADPMVAARLTFLQGDMAALSVAGTYDAVICPYFGLAHLPAGAAWRNVFAGVARRLKPGGLFAFHLPSAERMAQAPATPPDRPVFQAPLDASGRQLSIFIHARSAKPSVGRFDQIVDHVVVGPTGEVERRARERISYYAADPAPYALAAGLVLDRAAIDLGGVGAIHVFRRD